MPRLSITLHDFPVSPQHEDGPITVTIEYAVASEDRERFRTLMEEVQATCRRNGAFQCRLDESLDRPGLFRLDYMVSTWAEHLRQNMRMTVDETEMFEKAWELHEGDSEPVVRHFLSNQRSTYQQVRVSSAARFENRGSRRIWQLKDAGSLARGTARSLTRPTILPRVGRGGSRRRQEGNPVLRFARHIGEAIRRGSCPRGQQKRKGTGAGCRREGGGNRHIFPSRRSRAERPRKTPRRVFPLIAIMDP